MISPRRELTRAATQITAILQLEARTLTLSKIESVAESDKVHPAYVGK